MRCIHPVCVALVAAVFGAPAALAGGGNTLFTTTSFSTLFGNAKTKSTNVFGGYDDKKIIGGAVTGIKNFPFMANIAIMGGKGGKVLSQQCGSSILDKNHVLTAAHCFDNRNPKVYQVRVGSDFWRYKGQTVGISKIMIHPKYNNKTFDFDVAVVRLKKSLVMGKLVAPVSLVPMNTAIKADTPINLIGWGFTDALHSKATSGVLRAVTINTIAASECSDDYEEYEMSITARMFCAMGEGKDSCQGDSGGPVIVKRSGKQQGIISWGMGCAQMGSPGVFANVAHPAIRKFIDASLKK
ncbi:trypsin alpha-like [Thrips palmi]|uniref:Trypsin alpha-like n=1 Tax=Thrips palmi TaxID=161013 RepID=A0A6P8ZYY9_THRPL|nr:trypsin alpha-like [Thrips palmi]